MCEVARPGSLTRASYAVDHGRVEMSVTKAPPAYSDRLYLVYASAFPEFRLVYEALSHIGFYNLNPDRIRDLQAPDVGEILARDGSNLASVLIQLFRRQPDAREHIQEYLSKITPGISEVAPLEIVPKQTLEFRQDVAGSEHAWRFHAANMLDGTLRALGVLVAIFQAGSKGSSRTPLIAIEEPEAALHPGAARVLLDALLEAGEHTQVLVTSHSPDLLDRVELPVDSIFAVSAENGATQISRMDAASRQAVHDRLYTAGELLRMNQLAPDPVTPESNAARQLDLFTPLSPAG